jgi:hypothetical protein
MIWLDGGVVDFGKRLVVSVGPDTNQRTVFDGTISAIEAVFDDGQTPLVVLMAEDALMRLRMTRRMRSYQRVTDGDIASALADEHGLQAEVDVDGPEYDVVQQLNQSDLAFLRERARLVRAELWCEGRTLHLSSRPRRAGTQLTLVQGNHLLSVRLCADLAHQRSEVAVTGYDAQNKEVIDERGERRRRLGRDHLGTYRPADRPAGAGRAPRCGCGRPRSRRPRRAPGRRPRCCAGPGASSPWSAPRGEHRSSWWGAG